MKATARIRGTGGPDAVFAGRSLTIVVHPHPSVKRPYPRLPFSSSLRGSFCLLPEPRSLVFCTPDLIPPSSILISPIRIGPYTHCGYLSATVVRLSAMQLERLELVIGQRHLLGSQWFAALTDRSSPATIYTRKSSCLILIDAQLSEQSITALTRLQETAHVC